MRFTDLEVKVIGRRIGRSLRRGDNGISPDDFDGDGDGLVDDGLLTERPVTSLPDVDVDLTPNMEPPVAPPSKQRAEKGGGEPEPNPLAAVVRVADPKETRKARRKRAKKASQEVQDLVDGLITPLESDRNSELLKPKNLRYMLGKFIKSGVVEEPRTVEEAQEIFNAVALAMLDWFNQKKFKVAKLKPRLGEKDQRDVRDYYVITADRNPTMRKLFERFGIPPTVLADDIGGNTPSERPPAGFYQPRSSLMVLDAAYADFDQDEIDFTPTEDGKLHAVGTSTEALLRHEFFHHVDYMLIADSFEGKLSQRQLDDYRYLQEYYKRYIEPIQAHLKLVEENKAEWMRRMSTDDEYYLEFMRAKWMTTYGHTNFREFFAEMMTMATSRNRSMRLEVPRNLRKRISSLLGTNPWDDLLPYSDEYLRD